ncbi:MAG: hypothetical protein PCFJNLEI_03415 [Verrucomicrobiae bacterium]|nr:hypothetical protein [Verrucomicrobiae bacterium]
MNPILIEPAQVNEALLSYSDKDWNYSRITLEVKPLEFLKSPYVLILEYIDVSPPTKRKAFKICEDEVNWGIRHSNELGILELISLRINKALIELTSDEYWNYRRPVVKLVKKEELLEKGVNNALWYCVTEVAGEDFDNR